MKTLGLFLLAILTLATACGEEEGLAAHFAKQGSPDGRFVLEAREEDGAVTAVVVVESKSGRVVADLSDSVMLSEARGTSLFWSKDSRRFAANFHAGGRYDTMVVFGWAEDHFSSLPSPEGFLHEKYVDPAKQRELKTVGLPEGHALRRIWDAWKAMAWTDDSTLEIRGESVSSYALKGEPIDLTIAVQAKVRFTEAGKYEIVSAEEVPASD